MNVPSLVGYTESNKPIYLFDLNETLQIADLYSDFSEDDNFDALAVFSYLQLVYWRRYGEYSQEYIDAMRLKEFFRVKLPKLYMAQRKSALKLLTAFDVSKYGRKHCMPYLQELILT
jgi:hypothetical protein